MEWRELGNLTNVEELCWSGDGQDWLLALRLTFDGGRVTIEADSDDTLLVTHPAVELTARSDWSPPRDVSASPPWAEVIGRPILWAREMTNHHDWLDGFQLEFATGPDSVGTCIDMIAVASGLRIGRTAFPS